MSSQKTPLHDEFEQLVRQTLTQKVAAQTPSPAVWRHIQKQLQIHQTQTRKWLFRLSLAVQAVMIVGLILSNQTRWPSLFSLQTVQSPLIYDENLPLSSEAMMVGPNIRPNPSKRISSNQTMSVPVDKPVGDVLFKVRLDQHRARRSPAFPQSFDLENVKRYWPEGEPWLDEAFWSDGLAQQNKAKVRILPR